MRVSTKLARDAVNTPAPEGCVSTRLELLPVARARVWQQTQRPAVLPLLHRHLFWGFVVVERWELRRPDSSDLRVRLP